MAPSTRTTKREMKGSNLSKFFKADDQLDKIPNDSAIGFPKYSITPEEAERIHLNAEKSKRMTKTKKNFKSMCWRLLQKHKRDNSELSKTELTGMQSDSNFRVKRYTELDQLLDSRYLTRWYKYYRGWDDETAAKMKPQKSHHKDFHPGVDYWTEFEDFHMNCNTLSQAILFRRNFDEFYDRIPKRYQCLFIDNFNFVGKYGKRATMQRAYDKQYKRIAETCY